MCRLIFIIASLWRSRGMMNRLMNNDASMSLDASDGDGEGLLTSLPIQYGWKVLAAHKARAALRKHHREVRRSQ